MNERRVLGERVDIDYVATLDFFEGRAARATCPDALTTVLYQDDHPEVAEARHAFEIERVLPSLGLERCPRVLDIGCGNGRWARTLHGSVGHYLGVDFSPGLVDQARASLVGVPDGARYTFQVLSATELGTASLDVLPPFELVVVAGVLVYLNDDDVARVLGALPRLVTSDATVYVREPVAVADRLTLTGFESAELAAEYSAIYRNAAFYRSLLASVLGAAGFSFAIDEPISSSLANRAETTQHYFVLRRPAPDTEEES
jgi:SAM-dependent methyltransferase